MQRIELLDRVPRTEKTALAKAVAPYLRDRSSRLRINAVQIVSKEMLLSLEDQILLLLSDPNSMVRDMAVECLGNFHAGEAIRAIWLDPMLSDPEWLVRVETLESLAWIGDKAAAPLMARKLKDEHALVRGYAATCLADLEARRYRQQIVRAAEMEEDENAQIRFADALFRLGDKEQFPRIVKGLSSSSYQVRCASAHILADLELDAAHLQIARDAVSRAGQHALFRADRTTMETVEAELTEQQSIR